MKQGTECHFLWNENPKHIKPFSVVYSVDYAQCQNLFSEKALIKVFVISLHCRVKPKQRMSIPY